MKIVSLHIKSKISYPINYINHTFIHSDISCNFNSLEYQVCKKKAVQVFKAERKI